MRTSIITTHLGPVSNKLARAVAKSRRPQYRKMFFLTLKLIVAAVFLTGCDNAISLEPTATRAASASPVPPSPTLASSVAPSSSPSATPTRTTQPTRIAGPTHTARPPTLTPIPTAALIGGRTSKIAFSSCDSDVPTACEINVMNADGSDVIQLTNDNQVNCCPAWSPDGSKIAFVVQVPEDDTSEIWVMNADGSNPTNLTNKAGEDCCLAWSPDGSKIAFFSDRDASSSIYVMNADGSNPIRLTADTRVEHTPAWSPDGTRIAFFSGRHHDWVIYVMNPDGSNRIRLTNDHNDGRYPVWSPDGSKIAFIEYVKDYVYVMNADGSGLTYTTLRSSSLLSWLPTISTPSTLGPDCTSGWTRLTAGSQAKVSDENTTPNRVRSGPGTVNEIIAQLNPGTVVKILEGPVCTDRLVFWKVDSDLIPGGVGWTAEGDGTEYYLLPYQP